MGGGGAGLADRLGGKAGHVRVHFARQAPAFTILRRTAISVQRDVHCLISIAGQVLLPRLQTTSARFEKHGAAS